jgi:hypothetical protein
VFYNITYIFKKIKKNFVLYKSMILYKIILLYSCTLGMDCPLNLPNEVDWRSIVLAIVKVMVVFTSVGQLLETQSNFFFSIINLVIYSFNWQGWKCEIIETCKKCWRFDERFSGWKCEIIETCRKCWRFDEKKTLWYKESKAKFQSS